MNTKRLLKLAEFLDTLPKSKWDFDFWVRNAGEGKKFGGCGTIACALGWACTIPSFNRAGLTMEITDNTAFGVAGDPTFGSYFGADAGAKFFDIPMSVAEDLFIDATYVVGYNPTPKQVAKQIRKLVASNKRVDSIRFEED